MTFFYLCPVCGAGDEGCKHHEHAEPIKVASCTFCEGPGVPHSTAGVSGFRLEEDGSFINAYVFCHECGAQGPNVEDLIYELSEVRALVDRAVLLWNTRNNRHRVLSEHSERDGLNLHPRQDKAA